MDKVQWLCALSLALLLAGCLYHLRSGSVTAGPWTFSRQQSPIGFYVTVLALFGVGVVAILTVWVVSRPQ